MKGKPDLRVPTDIGRAIQEKIKWNRGKLWCHVCRKEVPISNNCIICNNKIR